jgi:hypothetical protein
VPAARRGVAERAGAVRSFDVWTGEQKVWYFGVARGYCEVRFWKRKVESRKRVILM